MKFLRVGLGLLLLCFQAQLLLAQSVPGQFPPNTVYGNKGTATAPAYITRTCWSPSAKSFGSGSISSTGWTGLLGAGWLWA